MKHRMARSRPFRGPLGRPAGGADAPTTHPRNEANALPAAGAVPATKSKLVNQPLLSGGAAATDAAGLAGLSPTGEIDDIVDLDFPPLDPF